MSLSESREGTGPAGVLRQTPQERLALTHSGSYRADSASTHSARSVCGARQLCLTFS